MCATHELSRCVYCDTSTVTVEEVTEGMWFEAFQDDASATPQCIATIVPVPSTAVLPARGLAGQLPRSDKPRHDVLVIRPDMTATLFARLAEARPDWVR